MTPPQDPAALRRPQADEGRALREHPQSQRDRSQSRACRHHRAARPLQEASLAGHRPHVPRAASAVRRAPGAAGRADRPDRGAHHAARRRQHRHGRRRRRGERDPASAARPRGAGGAARAPAAGARDRPELRPSGRAPRLRAGRRRHQRSLRQRPHPAEREAGLVRRRAPRQGRNRPRLGAMARIAVGGFHHETNCFVAERTDFAYFASHRDRPPLVRGSGRDRVAGRHQLRALGLPARHERPARDRAAAVDQRRRRRARHGRRLRAHRRRAGRPAVGGHAGRCGLPRPARRHGQRAVRGRRRRAAAPRARRGRADRCRSPSASTTTPTSRRRWWRRTDGLVAYRTYPHVDRPETGQHAARALSLLLERGRPPGRALRKLPVPDPAQRPVHAGRAVARAWSPARWWPRASSSTCPISRAFRPPTSTGAGRP